MFFKIVRIPLILAEKIAQKVHTSQQLYHRCNRSLGACLPEKFEIQTLGNAISNILGSEFSYFNEEYLSTEAINIERKPVTQTPFTLLLFWVRHD